MNALTRHYQLGGVPRLGSLIISLVGITFALLPQAHAQSTNFRAQGHYYSAKEAFEAGRYTTALEFVHKSKEALGGTNQQLEYLHVLSAFNANKFAEAQRELAVFFEIAERKKEPIEFDHTVERLTDQEIRNLTKLINRIDESAGAQSRADEARARDQREADLLNGLWVVESPEAEKGMAFRIKSYTTVIWGLDPGLDPEKTPVLMQKKRIYGEKTGENSDWIMYDGDYVWVLKHSCPYFDHYKSKTRLAYNKKDATITFQVVDVPAPSCEANGVRNYVLRKQQ